MYQLFLFVAACPYPSGSTFIILGRAGVAVSAILAIPVNNLSIRDAMYAVVGQQQQQQSTKSGADKKEIGMVCVEDGNSSSSSSGGGGGSSDGKKNAEEQGGVVYGITDIWCVSRYVPNTFVVCNGTSSVYVLNTENSSAVMNAFSCVPSSRKPNEHDCITSIASTSRGKHLQCLVGQRRVVTMDIQDDGSLIGQSKEGIVVMEKEKYNCHNVVCHPHRNVIATSGTDGCLRIWSS